MLRPNENEGGYFNDYCNWQSIPEIKDFVQNSPAASIVGQLMKCKFSVFYHEHVLVKEPSAKIPTPWHHDQSYYPIDGEDICSIWMPVDPVPLEATLKFVKGSHRWNKWFVPRKFETSNNYTVISPTQDAKQFHDVPEDDIVGGKWPIIGWPCEPGDCVVFHGKTLHGSDGNESENVWRRVLSTRWFGEDAKIASRPWEVSPPTRGGLENGAHPSGSEEFPILWRASA